MSSSESLVTIDAQDGCSELYLQDHQYTVVARGIGQLTARVAPGLYKVRQRIGDRENGRVIEVPAGGHAHITLDSLSYASPIPLDGTRTSREFQKAALGETLLTAPSSGVGQFSLLLRDSQWQYGGANADRAPLLERETARLRIQSLDGHYSAALTTIGKQEFVAGLIRVCVALAPGPYLLIQEIDEESQHCLALQVRANWALHVFLEMSTGAVDLDRSAIVYATPGKVLQPDDSGLALLEVARKAFARRRSAVASEIVDRILNGKFGNPVLGLLGSHLLLSAPGFDVGRAQRVIDNTARLLGEDFPDVIALRERLGVPYPAVPLASPPLLISSWNALKPEEISKFFWFPFTVEPTSTWLVWTESPDARRNSRPPPLPSHREHSLEPAAALSWHAFMSLQEMIEVLLSNDQLQPWVLSLKREERKSGSAPKELTALDRSLLSTLCSAQTSLIPGVIDAGAVAETIAAGLRIPTATARQSLHKLSEELARWQGDSDAAVAVTPMPA